MAPMSETDRPTLVLERILPVSPAAVFRAWTDPDSLRVFMCAGDFTSALVDADVRVGGRFRIVMREPGREVEHTGEYRTVDPPRRLAFTWVSPSTGPAGSLVTIDLSPDARGTRLVLTHEQLPDAEIVARHNRGWTSIFEKLERLLGTRAG
jgi:uncharacterized protein YndB with AHSA1/START domain